MIHELKRFIGKGTNHVVTVKATIETYRNDTMENVGITSVKLTIDSQLDANYDAYDGIAMSILNVSDTGALDFARYAGTVYGCSLQLESFVREMLQNAKFLHY